MTEKKPKIFLNPSLGEPLVEQLHRQFTWLIASGEFKPGDKLPTIRRLAQQLSINMHTVRSAYLQLEKDGLVRTRQGSGSQVLEFAPLPLMKLASLKRTYTIGVILPGLSNPFYHEFLQGVEEVISQEQLMLFVCNAHDDPEEYRRYYAQLSVRHVDGIIIASYYERMKVGQPSSAFLPVVVVDWPECPRPTVNLDLEDAAYQAVRHLLWHGHRRIGQVTYTGKSANVLAIEAGYQRALQEKGIALDESLIVRMPAFDVLSGESGAQQLLRLNEPPTAIFAVADMLALGVMKALKKARICIPEQMALASLDNIPLADLVEPGLTTVSLPARQMGVEAMRMLQAVIDGKKLPVEHRILPGRLVIGRAAAAHKETGKSA
jgi:LacI family repressor for deo operon, udp, cdd, tsx, nupC, and nupG